MDYSELICEYIINSYIFTSNIDGWCVKDIHQGRNIVLQRMINDLERVFPEMESRVICIDWYNKNIEITLEKISSYLSNFHLKLTRKPMAWDVVNPFGKVFDIKELMRLLPKHHNETTIHKIFDEWFDERVSEKTEMIF